MAYLAQLFIASFELTTIVFDLSKHSPLELNFLAILVTALTIGTHVFAPYYFGQRIISTSTVLLDDIYCSEW